MYEYTLVNMFLLEEFMDNPTPTICMWLFSLHEIDKKKKIKFLT